MSFSINLNYQDGSRHLAVILLSELVCPTISGGDHCILSISDTVEAPPN